MRSLVCMSHSIMLSRLSGSPFLLPAPCQVPVSLSFRGVSCGTNVAYCQGKLSVNVPKPCDSGLLGSLTVPKVSTLDLKSPVILECYGLLMLEYAREGMGRYTQPHKDWTGCQAELQGKMGRVSSWLTGKQELCQKKELEYQGVRGESQGWQGSCNV